MQNTYRSARLNHCEAVALGTVVRDRISLILDPRKQDDVRNSIGMLPDFAISGEITNESRRRHSCGTMDVHATSAVPDDAQQTLVLKYVHGGLVVEENPCSWDVWITRLECDSRVGGEKLEPDDHIVKVLFVFPPDARCNEGGRGLTVSTVWI
jgi:hypothetical protein